MATDPFFRMTVQDVFSIRGRGTVVTGTIESGSVSTGDEIYLNRDGATRKVVVSGLEGSRKVLQQAQSGDDVGLLLADLDKTAVQRGDVLQGSGQDYSWKP